MSPGRPPEEAQLPQGRAAQGAQVARGTATLIVTRPRAQCAAWLARLAELGVRAQALPLIEILPARDPDPVRAAWAALSGVDLAVFVSPNAVEQFFGGAERTWPVHTLAACVGPGSAQALAARGVPAACIVQPATDAASLDSEHLWQQLLPRRAWLGARVLLLRGDGGREWLAERLAEAGASIEAVTVYHRTGPRFDAAELALLSEVRARPLDHVWLFSSAEAVGHLLAHPASRELARQRAIATHPRIADAARRAGFEPVVLARPDPEAVTQALKAL
jgi:uroporphyrinogen-III synthase